jgi:hypothetical protein
MIKPLDYTQLQELSDECCMPNEYTVDHPVGGTKAAAYDEIKCVMELFDSLEKDHGEYLRRIRDILAK